MNPQKKTSKPRKSSKPRKPKQIKQPLTISSSFIGELKNLFKENPLIPSATVLLEKFKNFKNIPPKWTPNTSIKQLRADGIIKYSKKKPQGYSLDAQILSEFLKNKNTNVNRSTSKTIPSIKSKNPRSQGKADVKKVHHSTKVKVISNKKTAAEIIDKIPSIPQYLLKRFSSNDVKIMKMGVFDINRLPLQKVDFYLESLSSARILFDGNYNNEKIILEYIDAKIKYLSKVSHKLHEEEGERLIKKIFVQPMNEGKFDKILTKCMKKYDLDECAFKIIKKVGGKVKKIPLSEYALRKKIVEILSKRYSKKN